MVLNCTFTMTSLRSELPYYLINLKNKIILGLSEVPHGTQWLVGACEKQMWPGVLFDSGM